MEPTTDDAKYNFVSDLEKFLVHSPARDKLVFMGDISVSKVTNLWQGMITKETVGKANFCGGVLLTECL